MNKTLEITGTQTIRLRRATRVRRAELNARPYADRADIQRALQDLDEVLVALDELAPVDQDVFQNGNVQSLEVTDAQAMRLRRAVRVRRTAVGDQYGEDTYTDLSDMLDALDDLAPASVYHAA
jgi:hypothetical protein